MDAILGIRNKMGIRLYARWLFAVWGVLFWMSPVMAEEFDSAIKFKVAKLIDNNPLPVKKTGPSLVVTEKYEFYDIDGTSVAGLRSLMKRKGVRWNDGNVYAALTTWDMHPQYAIKTDNGKYAIQSISTDLAIVYHLPRWSSVTAAPEQMGVLWNTYMDHLKEHESGHKDLAVKFAAEINEKLASISSFTSKSALDNEVKQLVKANQKRLKELQIEYDRETRHGETQGVVLP